jgi:uncharacterized membrane-anchored protein
MKYIILSAFAILVLAQWIVPVRLIAGKQKVLEKGNSWLFRTQPVDPTDPFIGKYIRLDFALSSYSTAHSPELVRGQDIFVLLRKDSTGFAAISELAEKEPGHTADYIKARIESFYKGDDSLYNIRIDFPFNEYYMEEYKAPKAEKIYNERVAKAELNTYAKVKIWKGDAVTEDVIIGDKPISFYMQE